MDYNSISPKYMMELIPGVEQTLWELFPNSKYQNVRRYIEKWHEEYETYNNWNEETENFHIYFRDDANKEIDLAETLHKMSNDIVIKIAIDLGIDTPGFLPVVPQFKNILKDENQSAYQNFDRATKDVYENPDLAVNLASSTLEGVIKTILSDDSFATRSTDIGNKSLTKLVAALIAEFGFNDKTKCPQELITIAGQLRGIGATIDDLRSDKSTAHGKAHYEYVIDDPLWAAFIVNTSASLGMFLWEYYTKKYRPNRVEGAPTVDTSSDAPINLDEIPF